MRTTANPRHLKRAPVTDALMLVLRKAMGFQNSSAPTAPPGTTVLRNGALRINDVQYGAEYPNSYLDIYIADNDPTVSRPTFVYVHGGGFVLGDKVSGDPAAKGVEGFSIVSDPLLAAGFNLVSIDYALAPEFKYPVPLIQLSQAVAFLQEHGAEHGIDMSELIVGGGSAGGHIAAQFGLVESDPVYAARVGISPVTHGNLKALALDSAPFDINRVGKTQSPKLVPSVLFSLALRTYLGRTREAVTEANILPNVTNQYPATFSSDGNTGTFPDQLRDFHAKLNRLGVLNEADLQPESAAELAHGFMASPSRWTDAYNQKKVAFLKAAVA